MAGPPDVPCVPVQLYMHSNEAHGSPPAARDKYLAYTRLETQYHNPGTPTDRQRRQSASVSITDDRVRKAQDPDRDRTLAVFLRHSRPVGIGLLTGAAGSQRLQPASHDQAGTAPPQTRSPPVAEGPPADAITGQLPALLFARHGTTTGFRFTPAPQHEVAIETDRQVGGDLTFDRDTGTLRYTPAADDVEEFTLTLRAQGRRGPSTLGTLDVVPVAAIPAETRFIDNDRPVPKLPIYNDIRISAGKDQRWFNGWSGPPAPSRPPDSKCDSIPRTSMQS